MVDRNRKQSREKRILRGEKNQLQPLVTQHVDASWISLRSNWVVRGCRPHLRG